MLWPPRNKGTLLHCSYKATLHYFTESLNRYRCLTTGRGRQVIAVCKSADLLLMVLDASKPTGHKEILTRELEAVGIRLNRDPPNIYFKCACCFLMLVIQSSNNRLMTAFSWQGCPHIGVPSCGSEYRSDFETNSYISGADKRQLAQQTDMLIESACSYQWYFERMYIKQQHRSCEWPLNTHG